MQEEFDSQVMMERAGVVLKEIRKSEAFPAILGALAGGIAGALIAAIIASNRGGRQSAPAETAQAETGKRAFALRDVVQLLAVVSALAKQVQSWRKEQQQQPKT